MRSFFLRFFGLDRPYIRGIFFIVMFVWSLVFWVQVAPQAFSDEGVGVLLDLTVYFFLGSIVISLYLAVFFGRRNWKELFSMPFWQPVRQFPKPFLFVNVVIWFIFFCFFFGLRCLTLKTVEATGATPESEPAIMLLNWLLWLSPLVPITTSVLTLWLIRGLNKESG